MVQNKGLIFKEIPTGWPEIGKHIAIETRNFDLAQAPPAGGFTAKVHFISFDPYQRSRMRSPEVKSYTPAFEIGKPLTSYGIVTVIKSSTSKFKEGDLVFGRRLFTEEYSALDKDAAELCRILHNPHDLDAKLFIGALGMPGLTAYSSYYEIGEPKKGETIFVSAASGAVGQMVGQLAKHDGLNVIGSVGDDRKLEFIIKDLGFDGGFNYKKEQPLDALQRLAPEGIDIYFENVGGEQLEAAIDQMNDFGRIIVCGMVSQYNKIPSEAYGVKNLMNIFSKRLRMQGFMVFDQKMGPSYTEEHQKNVQKWISEGTFKARMSVTHGIENAGEGFIGMLEGKTLGKAVLEVSPL